MRILTLNAHSHREEEYEHKLQLFVQGAAAERLDLIALQEVSQTSGAPAADDALLEGYVPWAETVIRADNHAARAAQLLRRAGVACSWTWLPVKLAYGTLEEGLAMLALNRRIERMEQCLISRRDDRDDWRTRRALAVQLADMPDWFVNVHMGWWDDSREPFADQWKALGSFLEEKRRNGPVWLMGDFNAPAEIRREGYDLIRRDGWLDCHELAQVRTGDVTLRHGADGWKERMPSGSGLRIDHIWRSQELPTTQWAVVFDDVRQAVVSDHFGVLVETDAE